jgi:putative ABC transport system permease protein
MSSQPATRSAGMARLVGETWRLAWKDLWHDRRTTLVFVLTVAAIVAPLLLLLGLKNGVVTNLREILVRDPGNLEVIVYGSTRLPRSWFTAMAARDDVAFVIPKTRTINASVDVMDARRRLVPTVELLPTGPGDPLLPRDLPAPRRPDGVMVSATLAKRLGLASDALPGGATITVVIKRRLDGEHQHARLPLRVLGVVPERLFSRAALFAHPALLVAAEDYRDGLLDLPTGSSIAPDYVERRDMFANARVYARDLDAVGELAAAMRAQGIEVRTKAERIATMQAFDRTLSFLFRVIATIGGAGCALALGGALWVNVERKRRAAALLRLFGFGNLAVAALPVLQAVVVSAGGLLLALAVFVIGANVFNGVLGENLAEGGYVSRLGAGDLLMACGWMLLVAVLSASAAAWRSARVTPAEGLRESSL